MQLCRFTLKEDPEAARSGIFHDSRVYETQGMNAVGVHDLSRITFLPPIGMPHVLRAFDRYGDAWAYSYRNPSAIVGPMAEIDYPGLVRTLDVELRVGIVVKDRGEQIDREEAHEFVLGYTLALCFAGHELANPDTPLLGGAPFDHPIGVGPFLTTPDVFDPSIEAAYVFKVNGEPLFETKKLGDPFEELLVAASTTLPVSAGELLLGPAMERPSLKNSKLGRALRPGDSVQFGTESLGMLTLRIV